jgi:hypothetical protein
MLPFRYRPDPICTEIVTRALDRLPSMITTVRTKWNCESEVEIQEIEDLLYRRGWPRTAPSLSIRLAERVNRDLCQLHQAPRRSARLSPVHWLFLYEALVDTIAEINLAWDTSSLFTPPKIALGGHTVCRLDPAALVQLYFSPLDVLGTPPPPDGTAWQTAARRLCLGESPRPSDLRLIPGPGPDLPAPIALEADCLPIYPPLVLPFGPRAIRTVCRAA